MRESRQVRRNLIDAAGSAQVQIAVSIFGQRTNVIAAKPVVARQILNMWCRGFGIRNDDDAALRRSDPDSALPVRMNRSDEALSESGRNFAEPALGISQHSAVSQVDPSRAASVFREGRNRFPRGKSLPLRKSVKAPVASIPGEKAPAIDVLVANADPECAFRIFEDVIYLIAAKTVMAVINADRVRLIQCRHVVGSREVIEPDGRQHPPLACAILENGIRSPQSSGRSRYRQAKTPERMTIECTQQ